jgi:hypothetical protein
LISVVINVHSNEKNRVIIVNSFDEMIRYNIPVYSDESILFRINNCTDEKKVCAYGLSAETLITTFSTSLSLTCTTRIYNGLGAEVGSLSHTVSATFGAIAGRSPFQWNSLPYVNSGAGIGGSWGTIASTTVPSLTIGPGFAKSEGTFQYFGTSSLRGVQTSVTTTTNWYCVLY